MPEKIYRYLADDHARLDRLLQARYDSAKHHRTIGVRRIPRGFTQAICMEEKILLPAAQRLRSGESLPIAAKLRLDHGALAALLVPTPTPAIVDAIRAILNAHNPIEERADSLYEQCEHLAGAVAEQILVQLRSAAEVKVAPHMDALKVIEATRRALAKAGYNVEV